MKFGIDYLFGAKFARRVVNTHPEGWAAGFFHGIFRTKAGKIEKLFDSRKVVQMLIDSGKCEHFRIQAFWDDGHKYNKRGDRELVLEIADLWNEVAVRNPNVKIEFSPYCEHNEREVDDLLNAIKKRAPKLIPVNSKWKGAASRKYKNEVHNYDPKPSGKYNFSWDGANAFDADVTASKKKHSSADIYFLWIPQLNMRFSDNRTKDPDKMDLTPRPQRKIRPTARQLKALQFLATDRGRVRLPKGDLWKAQGEQDKKPSNRLRWSKPAYLTKLRGSRVELIGYGRKPRVYARLEKSGVHDGRNVWRLGVFGFTVALRALKREGRPVLRIAIDGKVVGRLNPGFRTGDYR